MTPQVVLLELRAILDSHLFLECADPCLQYLRQDITLKVVLKPLLLHKLQQVYKSTPLYVSLVDFTNDLKPLEEGRYVHLDGETVWPFGGEELFLNEGDLLDYCGEGNDNKEGGILLELNWSEKL